MARIDAQRRADLSGSIRQIDIAARRASSGADGSKPLNRFYRTYENGARETRLTCDRVEAPMHPIYEVDV